MKTLLLSFICCVAIAAHLSGATVTPQGYLSTMGPTCPTEIATIVFNATAGVGPFTVVVSQQNDDATYSFSNISNGNLLNIETGNPLTATTVYTLVSITGADGGVRTSGFTKKSVTQVVSPVPNASISAGGPTSFCEDSDVILTAKATANDVAYNWNTGVDNASLYVNTSGSYYCTVVNKWGCTATSKSMTVTVKPLPTVNITVGSNTLCIGGTAKLTVTKQTGGTYLWSNSASTQSITVNTTGGYSVTVTGKNGCRAEAADDLGCGDAPASADKTDNSGTEKNAEPAATTNSLKALAYPNPSTGAFHLKVSGGNMGNINIFVHDATGRLVEQRTGIAYTSDIILGDNYAAGIYIIRVQQDNSSSEIRVAKTE